MQIGLISFETIFLYAVHTFCVHNYIPSSIFKLGNLYQEYLARNWRRTIGKNVQVVRRGSIEKKKGDS